MGWLQALHTVVCGTKSDQSSGSLPFYAFPNELLQAIVERTGGRPVQLAMPKVRVWGPPSIAGRTPTAAFTIDGVHPRDIAAALAAEHVATWAGHSYAVEAVGQLGLAESGGVVRAGVVRYVEPSDVARLLAVVERLAG